MKKRRIVVTAFLLVAALVMGIGFAQVTGTLKIGGYQTFNGPSTVKSDIDMAMKFKAGSAQAIKNCTANITDDNTADITSTINDSGSTTDLSASAKYTVIYDTTENLQNVTLKAPTVSVLPYVNGAIVSDGSVSSNFQVTTEWSNLVGDGTINGDGTVTFAPGDTVDLTVTVEFVHPDPEVTGKEQASVNIGLVYESIG